MSIPHSTEVKIILSSLTWIKDKEANPKTINETGIIVDKILESLSMADDQNLDILNVLQDVFVVSANEADGDLKADLFKLFVTVQEIIESKNRIRLK